jgi:hypothetical protein
MTFFNYYFLIIMTWFFNLHYSFYYVTNIVLSIQKSIINQIYVKNTFILFYIILTKIY